MNTGSESRHPELGSGTGFQAQHCRIQSAGDHERRRYRQHTHSSMKSLRLPHEAFASRGHLSSTWSKASSKEPLVHRNFPRISGITGMNVPDDLTLSRGYVTPQRETPSQKNHPLSQRYRRKIGFLAAVIQELFTLWSNLASSIKASCLQTRLRSS